MSWTLTLTWSEATTHTRCISQIAAEADAVLLPNIDKWIADGTISATKKPNILYIDYIGTYNDNAANIAAELNRL